MFENLKPVESWGDWEVPFFFTEEPKETNYRIYHDGSHYIAVPRSYSSGRVTETRELHNEDIDILFDSLYFNAIKDGLKGEERTAYLREGVLKLFPEKWDIDVWLEKKIERKRVNLCHRKQRFRRKARLNEWTHFVTITFDDAKHTPESFRKKLRKCFSNLHTRRGWRYMGVFENAPETGRLHFHGLFYVPDGEMLGMITEKEDYDKHKGKMQTTFSNSFFAENFGRNDFKELSKMQIEYTNTLDYILKYIGKTGERIVYARGVPTEIVMKIKDSDIATEMVDFVLKYILFDDVIDWERDVMRYKPKQMTMVDYLCNPPRVA